MLRIAPTKRDDRPTLLVDNLQLKESKYNDQAHRQQWRIAEKLSSAAPC